MSVRLFRRGGGMETRNSWQLGGGDGRSTGLTYWPLNSCRLDLALLLLSSNECADADVEAFFIRFFVFRSVCALSPIYI